ncbi:hypothetical protein LX32DRAFT_590828 [Colletotrichum zoysiae]|uniref:BZIP domain-containing protein n=1 Tax=Colletotrichum zoysiae TaxID=1216348 RepID=A0AAD9HIC4_9PEZI|nr:hypothetical protein LX32DRAFT_590828 [Colletotrichum zoysiae]
MDDAQKIKEKRKLQNRIAQRRYRDRKKGFNELCLHPSEDAQVFDYTTQESHSLVWDQPAMRPFPLKPEPQNISTDTEVANTPLDIVVEDPLLSDLGISILDQWLQQASSLSPLSDADFNTTSTESSHFLQQPQTDPTSLPDGDPTLLPDNNSSNGNTDKTLEVAYAEEYKLLDNTLPTNCVSQTAGNTMTRGVRHTTLRDLQVLPLTDASSTLATNDMVQSLINVSAEWRRE